MVKASWQTIDECRDFESGSHEDQGDWHSDWGCVHPFVIFGRHRSKVEVSTDEMPCILASLDNSADIVSCSFGETGGKAERLHRNILNLRGDLQFSTSKNASSVEKPTVDGTGMVMGGVVLYG